jgi:hypothetical protein
VLGHEIAFISKSGADSTGNQPSPLLVVRKIERLELAKQVVLFGQLTPV